MLRRDFRRGEVFGSIPRPVLVPRKPLIEYTLSPGGVSPPSRRRDLKQVGSQERKPTYSRATLKVALSLGAEASKELWVTSSPTSRGQRLRTVPSLVPGIRNV